MGKDVKRYLMMKLKLLFLLSSAVAFVGCMDKTSGGFDDRVVQIAAIEPLEDYVVPIKAGYISVVTFGEQMLAVTPESMRIAVPRGSVASGALKVEYTQDEIYNNYAWSRYWQYISFEDTRNSDYDYNDLVIHCRVRNDKVVKNGQVTYNHVVSVQPIALGGTRKLKLGILYKKDDSSTVLSEAILCNDVRAELFFGNPVFPINTDRTKGKKQVSRALVPLFECETTKEDFRVVWFIENDTDRLHAATTSLGADRSCDMISSDGLPYGISLKEKWNYPAEKNYVGDVYPGFKEWIRTGDEAALIRGYNLSLAFPACKMGHGEVDLWDYDI